ncbi:MAG: hypothetical protein AAB595_01350 [Patescibacteria group bacterium]
MILPSKKVLSIFILTVALVAAIIIAFGRDKSSEAINFASNLVVGEKVSIPENPDWQNELGGVTMNAELVQEENASTTETTTDTISKTLVLNYLALKQSGSLDTMSAQKLIDQTLDYIGKIGGQVVLVSNLNTIPDNDKQTITEYGENLGKILKYNKPKETKNEIEIATKAVISKDQNKINELDSIIAVYQKISDELIKMPVPKTFIKAHLDMINGMNSIALALKEMKEVVNDPFRGLKAMQLYQEGTTMFTQSERATRLFINQNKIIYKQGSGGYYLLYGI